MQRFFLLMLIVFTGMFQAGAYTVKGKVVNANGQPLPNVLISQIGASNEVQTMLSGHYTISIKAGAAILRFSLAGYRIKEITVASDGIQNVQLDSANQNDGTVLVPPKQFTNAMLNGTEPYPATASRSLLVKENPFKKTVDIPGSAFSVNVDGPTYNHIYRFSQRAEMPSPKMIKLEELINYFRYDYPQPAADNGHPFNVITELGQCPWNKQHQLLLVALQGKDIDTALVPPSNLVFLVDISGSMKDAVKLPLVKTSLLLLAKQMRAKDKITVVAYAGNANLVLSPTDGNNYKAIETAINSLQPAGYTAGSAGIQMAFKTAKQHFIPHGNNRIILCTDGDFNVGITANYAVDSLIEAERKTGVFLSVLGFGTNRQEDIKMRRWAEKGNGNHHIVSGLNEARQLFVNEYANSFYSIAKDVRPLVQFNPAKVQAYRLIGYDVHADMLAPASTAANTLEEAGELGSGHTVTVLYEIIPPGVQDKYTTELAGKQFSKPASTNTGINALCNIEVRYKKPFTETMKQLNVDAMPLLLNAQQNSKSFLFAASVASFGLLIKDSEYKQKANYKELIAMARLSAGSDASRKEFITVAENMQRLAKQLK